jgi:hypothetical protein
LDWAAHPWLSAGIAQQCSSASALSHTVRPESTLPGAGNAIKSIAAGAEFPDLRQIKGVSLVPYFFAL